MKPCKTAEGHGATIRDRFGSYELNIAMGPASDNFDVGRVSYCTNGDTFRAHLFYGVSLDRNSVYKVQTKSNSMDKAQAAWKRLYSYLGTSECQIESDVLMRLTRCALLKAMKSAGKSK